MDESDSSVYRLLGHITGPQMYRECISNTINASESVIIIAKEWRRKRRLGFALLERPMGGMDWMACLHQTGR
jgi:hypothetical protein